MDEIVSQVAEKTGVGADTVRRVLTSALDVVKQKLPPQFASQVDLIARGGGGAGGPGSAGGAGLGNIASGLLGRE